MATATPYQNPNQASAGLTAAFGPTNDAQRAAIAGDAALVPGQNPVTPPVNRSVDTGANDAENYLNKFTPPETADQIAERLRQGSQGVIDSLNKTYDDQVAAAGKTGQEKLAMDNAVSVLSGLTGSTEASRTRGAVLDTNDKAVQAINNERLSKTQAIYSQLSQQAESEAQLQKEDATKSAQDILARRTQVQTDAVNNLKLLAQGGLVDFDSFKNSPQNANVYQHALDAVGGSEQALRGLFAVNRPQDQLVGAPTRVGDHFIQAYKNPLTGKVSYDTIQVPGGLPAEYNNFQKVGNSIIAIPDNWDGDTSKLKTIAGGGGPGAENVTVAGPGGAAVNVPVDVAPYYDTSHSGVGYADLSTVQGTASEKKAVVDAAQRAGIKVITNKNTALDLTNIKDAFGKLDSISTIMTGIDQPDAMSRNLYGLGLTKLATMAQSNPQQAAAGALQGVGLDILKAISGVQGFRGNASVVQQITDHLPSIYDTNDVVQTKVKYIQTLIADREDAIVGKAGTDRASGSASNSDPLGLGI